MLVESGDCGQMRIVVNGLDRSDGQTLAVEWYVKMLSIWDK